MRPSECIAAAVCMILLAGCAEEPGPSEAPAPPAPADASVSTAAPVAATTTEPSTQTPPFKPVATVRELMNGTIVHAAEVFWGAVTVVVDADGEHELYPETNEQWEAVWAAAITIAESGNLLMMEPRAADDGPWQQYSLELIEAGTRSARAARAKDPEQIFATGEEVYNVCTGCHMVYSPNARETLD